MRIFIPFVFAIFVLLAQVQLYKWTDSNGTVHYSDPAKNGAEVTEIKAGPPLNMRSSADNWREREQESRRNRALRTVAERYIAAGERRSRAGYAPFSPSMNRSNKPMGDDEVCDRDHKQIEYAEQVPSVSITSGIRGRAT